MTYDDTSRLQTCDLTLVTVTRGLVYIEQESENTMYDYIFTIASQRMDGIWQTVNLLAGTSLYFSTCSTLLSQPSDNPHQTFHCIRWNQSNNFTIHWVCRIHLGKTWRKTYWIELLKPSWFLSLLGDSIMIQMTCRGSCRTTECKIWLYFKNNNPLLNVAHPASRHWLDYMEHSHCKKWQHSFPAHLTHSHEIDLKLNYFQITFIKKSLIEIYWKV